MCARASIACVHMHETPERLVRICVRLHAGIHKVTSSGKRCLDAYAPLLVPYKHPSHRGGGGGVAAEPGHPSHRGGRGMGPLSLGAWHIYIFPKLALAKKGSYFSSIVIPLYIRISCRRPGIYVPTPRYLDCPAQLPIACISGFPVAAQVPRYLGPGT